MAHLREKSVNSASEIEVDGPVPQGQEKNDGLSSRIGEVEGNASSGLKSKSKSKSKASSNSLGVLWYLLTYTPQRCRWDPANPVKFSWGLTFLFAFATTFTVGSCSCFSTSSSLFFFIEDRTNTSQASPSTKQRHPH